MRGRIVYGEFDLERRLGGLNPPPAVENALEKSEAIEDKVQSCAEELTTVNQALEEDVQERERLEHQLITVQKQEETAREAAFAARLKNVTRDDDTVSRDGGDEFLYLLLQVKTERDVAAIAEKIIRAVGEPCEAEFSDRRFAAWIL